MAWIPGTVSQTAQADRRIRQGLLALAVLAVLVAFAVALAPEPPARLLTSREGWTLRGHVGTMSLQQFPVQFQAFRDSVLRSPQNVMFRSWSPEHDLQAIEVVSPPFRAPRALSVAITGSTRTLSGGNAAYLECSTHAQRRPVFSGSVNITGAETVVRLPRDWCAGETRLHLVTTDRLSNAGVGSVAEVSRVSAWKQSFIGLLPYLVTAAAILAAIGLAGAAAARRVIPAVTAVVSAGTSIGLMSLAAFYAYAMLPIGRGRAWVPLGLVLIIASLVIAAGQARLRETARELAPYGKAWAIAAIGYFALLCAVDNGLGHWNPNYRFWPSAWSSDNELPWLFAEALRLGTELRTLFGGNWLPTDRPPLMAGAHLLWAEPFTWLQRANDGHYLRGQAYNAAAVALNALWVPAALHVLRSAAGIGLRPALAAILIVGLLPFSLFNTVYGWPKAFGAAFGMLAFAAAVAGVRHRERQPIGGHVAAFGATSALSILAHASGALFLLPVAAWMMLRGVWRSWRSWVVGALLGGALLATWALYRHAVLPSPDPVTRYALTGDYGFGASAKSLLTMLQERYASFTFPIWLDIKARMLLQPLVPIDQMVAQIHMNGDFGCDVLGRLRAWDFLMLSAGNLALLIAAVWSLGRGPRDTGTAPERSALDETARLGSGLAFATWLLLGLFFLAPLVNHHWPNAAITLAGCTGFAWCATRRPLAFRVLTVSTLLYVTIVWLAGPLHDALRLDVPALAVALALFGTLVIRVFDWPAPRDSDPAVSASPAADHAPSVPLRFDYGSGLLSWGHPRPAAEPTEHPALQRALRIATVVALLGFLAFLVFTVNKPLLDDHSFRQTQTALSVYEMLHGGPKIAYYTPVLGLPWAIPFEAPVYHWGVAALATLLPLEASGRIVSALYLLGAVYLGYRVMRRLLPESPLPAQVFALLSLTSPLYVFWGRAFMIETCAVFFGMVHWYFGLRSFETGSRRDWVLGTAGGVLSGLAKATTWPGFVVALGLSCLLRVMHTRAVSLKRVGLLAVMVAIPLACALIWTAYTDQLKMLNPLGRELTSTALKFFNYGLLAQRLSQELWSWSVLIRMLPDILGLLWFLGAGLVLWAATRESGRRVLPLAVGLMATFLFPILTFTNLHIVHNYYQTANGLFLVMAIAVLLGTWLGTRRPVAAVVVLALLVGGQAMRFRQEQWVKELGWHEQQDIMDAGRFVREHTVHADTLLAVGVNWSSIAHYYAQRRGLAMRAGLPDQQALGLLDDPARSVGTPQYSAIIDCRPLDPHTYSVAQAARLDALFAALSGRPDAAQASFGPCRAVVGHTRRPPGQRS